MWNRHSAQFSILWRDRDLSPLARNIVDLMCADCGVTGRILKPYLCDLLATVLPLSIAARLTADVTCLSLELEIASRRVTEAKQQYDRRSHWQVAIGANWQKTFERCIATTRHC